MSVFLKGIAIAGYRGIGAEQKIGPFDRFNFFAGANNSGKSTVLDFIYLQFSREQEDRRYTVAYVGTQRHTGSNVPERSLRILETKTAFQELLSKRVDGHLFPHDWSAANLLNLIWGDEEHLWFSFDPASGDKFRYFSELEPKEMVSLADRRHWEMVWRFLTRHSGGGSLLHSWVPETLQSFDSTFSATIPKSHLVPAIRQVGKSGEDFEGYSGQGIIDHLQALQNPPPNREEDRNRFAAINRLVQTVLGKPDARIEIPHTKESIVVHMDNKSLALEDLGTGIQEVILIGAYCTIYDGSIMCLEEPEIHLHPVLQRQLLDYLRTETSSQYFIATHSAAFLDMPNGRVFAVSNDGVTTKIRPLNTRSARRILTDELGYLASDIVQSNAIIWVEGPSDRLYLLNWMEQVDSDLREGIHFSIMFYGGRLLSNLSGDSELTNDFINLKSLNQCSAIVIDSDRDKPKTKPNATKKRIEQEFGDSNGFAWITKGREIENYLDPDKLEAAMKTVHPQKFGKVLGLGDYDNRLIVEHKKTKAVVTCDKVKVAQEMCCEPLSIGFLDLEKKLTELVAFVGRANGA